MISRLKEIIEKYNAGCYNETCNTFESCTDCVLKQIREVIESQPPADSGPDTNVGTNQWIPCSERRPRKNEVIIGTFQNDKGKTMVVTDTYFPCLLNEPWKLVAWIPLPEPYKGE